MSISAAEMGGRDDLQVVSGNECIGVVACQIAALALVRWGPYASSAAWHQR